MPELSAATCVAAVPGLQWRAWPGEESAAVYVPSSGRTHWVTALGLAILEQSAAGPRCLADLAKAIFEAEPCAEGAMLAAADGATLAGAEEPGNPLAESAQGLIQAGLLQIVQCPSS